MDDSVHRGVFQPDLVVHGLDRYAHAPLLILADGTVQTGLDIAHEISRLQKAMARLGVSKGSRVALLAGNRAEVLHIGTALQFMEAVFVPLHPLGSVEDYAYVVDDSSIDTVIYEPSAFARPIEELRSRRPDIRCWLSLGSSDFASDLLAAARTTEPSPLEAPLLDGSEVYRLAYSGGTTGKPKAIQLTHSVSNRMLDIQLAEWEWPSEIRQLLCAPLSHSGAALFMPTLMRGGTIYIQRGFDPVAVLEAIQTHRITCVLLVPTMIYALLDHPRFDKFDLSSLETIFYGASLMSPERLREGIERIGPVFFQFYGQAEAPMTVTVMRRAEHLIDDPQRLASCGRPVPWVHTALLDAQGQPVAKGAPGEICVRGPLVMPGYLNKDEQTAEAFRHGWLHTGDIAIEDEDGFLRIVDRSKDMIITGGFNVYPREVEDAITAHPAVAAACVVGLPDAHWGEQVFAAIVLRPDAKCTDIEIREHVVRLKGKVQSPKRIEFVDAIPLTAVGKPDKKAVRAQWGQVGEAAAP